MSATASSAIQWKLLAFNALSLSELHDVLQLRSEVFVLEQRCVFQDIDGTDTQATHLLGSSDGQLLAYARCLPAGIKSAEANIGRVLIRRQARGRGLGHLLMDKAVASVCALWGVRPIRIGAQTQLEKFYNTHGFVDVGKPYIEDGIDHLEMVWQP